MVNPLRTYDTLGKLELTLDKTAMHFIGAKKWSMKFSYFLSVQSKLSPSPFHFFPLSEELSGKPIPLSDEGKSIIEIEFFSSSGQLRAAVWQIGTTD